MLQKVTGKHLEIKIIASYESSGTMLPFLVDDAKVIYSWLSTFQCVALTESLVCAPFMLIAHYLEQVKHCTFD